MSAGYPVPVGAFPPNPGQIFKMVFFLNGPKQGWTETYYVTPNTPPVATGESPWLDSIAATYAQQRGSGLTSYCSFQAYRMSDVSIPGNSILRVPKFWPKAGLIASNEFTGANNIGMPEANGVQMRLSDGLNVVRRNEIYRGIPVQWIAQGNATPSSLNTASDSLQGFRTAIQVWGATLGLNPNTGLGKGLLKFVVKDPALITKQPIIGITVNSQNMLVVNVPALPVIIGQDPLRIGSPVRIGGVRQKCARKINGVATIIHIDNAQSPQTGILITLCKTNCCLGTPLLCPRNAYLYPQVYAYTQIQNVSLEQLASRKVGRPFRQRPGRRLNCC